MECDPLAARQWFMIIFIGAHASPPPPLLARPRLDDENCHESIARIYHFIPSRGHETNPGISEGRCVLMRRPSPSLRSCTPPLLLPRAEPFPYPPRAGNAGSNAEALICAATLLHRAVSVTLTWPGRDGSDVHFLATPAQIRFIMFFFIFEGAEIVTSSVRHLTT